MARRVLIAEGEWYHCFNRGVDKRRVFMSQKDMDRFLMLMYLSNSSGSNRAANVNRTTTLMQLFNHEKLDPGSPLVEIGSYCLMPNHIHFVIKEINEGGVAAFMQRLFTGYTMYFNAKHERTGPLFSGRYKSRHLSTDRYFKHAINYVHMNPIELFEPDWKTGSGNLGVIEERLRAYRYSSLPDHAGERRPERKLLGSEVFTLFNSPTSLSSILFDAQAYYRESGGF